MVVTKVTVVSTTQVFEVSVMFYSQITSYVANLSSSRILIDRLLLCIEDKMDVSQDFTDSPRMPKTYIQYNKYTLFTF